MKKACDIFSFFHFYIEIGSTLTAVSWICSCLLEFLFWYMLRLLSLIVVTASNIVYNYS